MICRIRNDKRSKQHLDDHVGTELETSRVYPFVSGRAVPARTLAGRWRPRSAEGCTRSLGDSKNTARGYCLDIPRFEESLNN